MVSISYNNSEKKYVINVTESLPKEFLNLVNDIVKFVIVIIIYNFMLYSKDHKLSNIQQTFEQIFYIVLGLAFYWIIFFKLFQIV